MGQLTQQVFRCWFSLGPYMGKLVAVYFWFLSWCRMTLQMFQCDLAASGKQPGWCSCISELRWCVTEGLWVKGHLVQPSWKPPVWQHKQSPINRHFPLDLFLHSVLFYHCHLLLHLRLPSLSCYLIFSCFLPSLPQSMHDFRSVYSNVTQQNRKCLMLSVT